MEIHAAAFRGDLEGVRYCLSRGVPIDQKDRQGDTPLLQALHSRKVYDRRKGPRATTETVRFLLDTGADVHARGYLGRSPLHAAAESGVPEWVELLCERGAAPHAESDGEFSTLVSACYQPPSPEKLRIIRALAGRGVSLDRASKYGESPLNVTLWRGDIEAFRVLLELGADRTPLQWTNLHDRIILGTFQELKAYSRAEMEIDQRDGRWELLPLFWAAKTGDVDKVKYLVEQGAQADQRGRFGTTALHIAAELDRLEVVEWLLAQGLEAESRDDSLTTPLMSACSWGALRSVRALLDAGVSAAPKNLVQSQAIHDTWSLEILKVLVEQADADINQISGDGRWPLMSAAEQNDVERCEWLIAHGAEVDQSSTGATALHSAVQEDSREAIRFLLERGADPNRPDVDGWTPLFCAQSREAIQILLRSGADPKIQDQVGNTAERWLSDPLLRELVL
jgi:serine/threonine-protein phosphatase 6 regulatory ankyrin repeat subunit B